MDLNLTIAKRQDSSKIQGYLTCPRMYLFKYILGYKPDEPIHNLIFGSAFHKAKETLLQTGYSEEGVKAAYAAFLDAYRPYYGVETDQIYDPKSPGKVELALYKYVIDYNHDRFKLLETEVGFAAMLSDSRILYGRLDAVIERQELIYVLETKTSKALWSYWTDQWTLKFQISAYTHALYSFYPSDKIGGVIVDGTIFKKKKGEEIEHVRVSVNKNGTDLLNWLSDTNRILDQIESDFAELEASNPDQAYLRCFRRNPESCIQYNRLCEFHELCSARPNPLSRMNFIPAGYKRELWDCTKQPVTRTLTKRKEGKDETTT